MMTFDPALPLFWDETDLQSEIHRVFEICNGCRLCDRLCPSFDLLFRRIEAEDDAITASGGGENPVDRIGEKEIRAISDLCYQCKLCYPKCPYVPPHKYELDFPRLLLREQAQHLKKEGISLRDRMLSDPDRIGKAGSTFPGLMNFLNGNGFSRFMMEKTAGIHRDKKMPLYAAETFEDWFAGWKSARPPKDSPAAKAALFSTCLVSFNNAGIGRAAVRVLDHNNVEVVSCMRNCCGIPNISIGDVATATRKADANIASMSALIDQGFDIVIPSPSCSMMIKHEYPLIATDREAGRKVASRSYDLGEYIMKLEREGKLRTDFSAGAGKILYHLPCHLKAQNIGYKSRDMLNLIPGAEVEMAQHCAGHDGQFSMKREYYQISLEVGKKLFDRIAEAEGAEVVSDCAFAHLHIDQGSGKAARHPIELLARAYGLEE